jgi:hypothetical protein
LVAADEAATFFAPPATTVAKCLAVAVEEVGDGFAPPSPVRGSMLSRCHEEACLVVAEEAAGPLLLPPLLVNICFGRSLLKKMEFNAVAVVADAIVAAV